MYLATPLKNHQPPQGERAVPNDKSFSTDAVSPFWITPFVFSFALNFKAIEPIY